MSITKVECDEVDDNEGAFTTSCAVTIDGSCCAVQVEITGTIDGDTVTVSDATSDATILNDELAVKATQQIVAAVAPTVTVTSCTLPQQIVLVEEGLTFTCATDSDETVTIELHGREARAHRRAVAVADRAPPVPRRRVRPQGTGCGPLRDRSRWGHGHGDR